MRGENMFYVIRVILWLILSFVAFTVIRKTIRCNHALATILSVTGCLAIISFLSIFPIENTFINFKSPESVFYYTSIGNIEEQILGQDSCMIVYSKGNSTFSHYIVPKKGKGYKIPCYFAEKKIWQKNGVDGVFEVYHIAGTDDYYVLGAVYTDDDRREIEVFKNSEKVETRIARINNTHFIYFNLQDFSGDYYLLIDGEKISISGEASI